MGVVEYGLSGWPSKEKLKSVGRHSNFGLSTEQLRTYKLRLDFAYKHILILVYVRI